MIGYNWTIEFESAEGDLPMLVYSTKVCPFPFRTIFITYSNYYHPPLTIPPLLLSLGAFGYAIGWHEREAHCF